MAEGASVLDVVEANPSLVRVEAHLTRVHQMRRAALAKKTMRTDLKVIWIYGPAGAGKTRLAFELGGGVEKVYRCAKHSGAAQLWFDHYEGEDVVLLDDIRHNTVRFDALLNLLDIYPIQVAVKGGSDYLTANTIILTAVVPPELMFGGNASGQRRVDAADQLADVNDVGQLMRRITQRIRFNADGTWVDETREAEIAADERRAADGFAPTFP